MFPLLGQQLSLSLIVKDSLLIFCQFLNQPLASGQVKMALFINVST